MWSAGDAIWGSENSSDSGEFPVDAYRVPLRVSVALYIDGHLRVERASNVWENGLAITMREPLPIGTRLEVEFFLPGGFDVHCQAIVRRHLGAEPAGGSKQTVDVELVDPDNWAQTAIRDHVAARRR